ncbi:MAG: ROK family protein, partial [Demequinaceae bacterium]|nr:ROK family protein [Demequinaceae bacterium]
NPQCIVVGGELAETGEVLLAPMRDAIRRRVLLNQIAPLEVVPAELGSAAEVMGALGLVLQQTDVDVTRDELAEDPDGSALASGASG